MSYGRSSFETRKKSDQKPMIVWPVYLPTVITQLLRDNISNKMGMVDRNKSNTVKVEIQDLQ